MVQFVVKTQTWTGTRTINCRAMNVIVKLTTVPTSPIRDKKTLIEMGWETHVILMLMVTVLRIIQ